MDGIMRVIDPDSVQVGDVLCDMHYGIGSFEFSRAHDEAKVIAIEGPGGAAYIESLFKDQGVNPWRYHNKLLVVVDVKPPAWGAKADFKIQAVASYDDRHTIFAEWSFLRRVE